MGEHLKWLRGPLPPLSECIVRSGLVNDPSLAPPPTNDQQAIWGSMTAPKAKLTRLKPPKVAEAKPARETKSKLSFTSSPVLPPAEVSKQYKPPPIEAFAEVAAARARVQADKLMQNDQKRQVSRTDVGKITQQLDSALATVTDGDDENPEKKAQARRHMLKFYNFAFNELILVEKDNCSDKAILLRRFKKFYNGMLEEMPGMGEGFGQRIDELEHEIEGLKAELAREKKEKEDALAREEEMKKEVEDLTEKLRRLTKESNDKDVQIEKVTDDRNYYKGLFQQIKMKLEIKEAEVNGLRNAVEERDAEIKRQLDTNEENSKKLDDFANGETGYIVVYHEEKAKREVAEKKIEELNQKLEEILSREHVDQCVDTSDLRLRHKRKKKGSPGKIVRSRSTGGHLTLASAKEENEDDKSIASWRNTMPAKSSSNVMTYSSKLIDEGSLLETKEIQTEPGSQETSDIDEPLRRDTADQAVQTDPVEIVEPALGDDDAEPLPEVTVLDIEYRNPIGYSINNSAVDAVPDLLSVVTPFLSQTYVPSQTKELKVVNASLYPAPDECDRPLVWVLQMIHNFMTDPYLRSVQHQSKLSIEAVFVDWVMKQYKLQHLVNQVVADFSYMLSQHEKTDKMLQLFNEILQSRYTLSEVCFMATIYSFTVPYTFPCVLETLQSMDMEPNFSSIKIHVVVAFKILAKCFSPGLANAFLQGKASAENPLLDYIDFLRESALFFGTKHRQVYAQAKDLLVICGCPDTNCITFEKFASFFSFIDPAADMKQKWNAVMDTKEDKDLKYMPLIDLIASCAEKRAPLMKLLSFTNLSETVSSIREMRPSLFTLYDGLVARFCRTIPYVLSTLDSSITKPLWRLNNQLKEAILKPDLAQSLWFYKLFLLKADQIAAHAKGSIPLPPRPSDKQIQSITEYYNQCESVSLAFV